MCLPGKSTLLNTITGAGVLAEDQLFATLDPTTRRVRLKGNKEVRGRSRGARGAGGARKPLPFDTAFVDRS